MNHAKVSGRLDGAGIVQGQVAVLQKKRGVIAVDESVVDDVLQTAGGNPRGDRVLPARSCRDRAVVDEIPRPRAAHGKGVGTALGCPHRAGAGDVNRTGRRGIGVALSSRSGRVDGRAACLRRGRRGDEEQSERERSGDERAKARTCDECAKARAFAAGGFPHKAPLSAVWRVGVRFRL